MISSVADMPGPASTGDSHCSQDSLPGEKQPLKWAQQSCPRPLGWRMHPNARLQPGQLPPPASGGHTSSLSLRCLARVHAHVPETTEENRPSRGKKRGGKRSKTRALLHRRGSEAQRACAVPRPPSSQGRAGAAFSQLHPKACVCSPHTRTLAPTRRDKVSLWKLTPPSGSVTAPPS